MRASFDNKGELGKNRFFKANNQSADCQFLSSYEVQFDSIVEGFEWDQLQSFLIIRLEVRAV
jgi:hypothetical protein